MQNTEFIIWCVKLIFGGVCAFLAILMWSKSRRGYLTCLSSYVVISYIGLIYNIMTELGVFSVSSRLNFYITLGFAVLPQLLLVIALILIIKEIL